MELVGLPVSIVCVRGVITLAMDSGREAELLPWAWAVCPAILGAWSFIADVSAIASFLLIREGADIVGDCADCADEVDC